MIRHGTRNPTKKDIQAAANLHERVQQLLARPIVTKSAVKLGEWDNPFGPDSAGMLVSSGMKEVFCLAERVQSRFGNKERWCVEKEMVS